MASKQTRMSSFSSLYGVSLFSGAGLGDIGFREAGINFLSMCELESDRGKLAELNFPHAIHFHQDINEAVVPLTDAVNRRLREDSQDLFLVACTAPCQGMSKSGRGTLLSNIRKGKRPTLDPRNRLILPGLEIIRRLRPLWVVFENVIEMRDTVILDNEQQLRPILDIVKDALSPEYVGEAYDIEFADYGIPQRRQRLITVYTRCPNAKSLFHNGARLVPPATHAKKPTRFLKRWVSVTEALEGFPPLDARDKTHATCSKIPFHRVPILEPKKYEWVRHTAPASSAFDNQCVNPSCRYAENPSHGARRGKDGINRSCKDTPLYCNKCGSLLPRPFTEMPDGSIRLMSGYTSAYKRMEGSLPAPALTRNLSYACSDQKLHPTQNRVLSLAEAMRLHTISDYDYRWGVGSNGSKSVASDTLIRLVIGESVPPRFLELLGHHVRRLSFEDPPLESVRRIAPDGQAMLW